MAFINVKDLVALVVDRENPRFGQIAAVTSHDWREYGIVDVRFLDGKTEEFYDGLMRGDPPPKARRYYRYKDDFGSLEDRLDRGPSSFQRDAVACGRSLADLAKDYEALFGEQLPNF